MLLFEIISVAFACLRKMKHVQLHSKGLFMGIKKGKRPLNVLTLKLLRLGSNQRPSD